MNILIVNNDIDELTTICQTLEENLKENCVDYDYAKDADLVRDCVEYEDNEEFVFMESMDMLIAPFLSAKKALAYAAEHRPDIVFVDIEVMEAYMIHFGKELTKLNPKVNVLLLVRKEKDRELIYDAAKEYRPSGVIDVPVTGEQIELEFNNLKYPILG